MDLTFHTPKGRFNYRVGAVILREGKILLMYNDTEKIFYTPGGRVKFGETTEEAVVREVGEELAIQMEVERPLCFHEDFYDEKCTGEFFHEIAVYYLMKDTPDLDNIRCESVTELGAEESLHWVDIDKVETLNFVPKTLLPTILELPLGMTRTVEIC